MPTAEVLCTHQGVSQSRGKSICPAQGSPVFVINNPDLKCGYCFQCIHQLEKQKKNMQNYSFLILSISFALKPATPAICVRGGGCAFACVIHTEARGRRCLPPSLSMSLFYFVVCVCYTCLCGCVHVCLQVYMYLETQGQPQVLFLHDSSTIFSGILSLNQKPTDLDCSVCELCISTCLYCPPHLLVP